MKNIQLIIQNPQILKNTPSSLVARGSKAVLTSIEGWQLSASCREADKAEDRELTELKIYLPGGNKSFTGTLQDLASLPVILKNAYDQLMKFSSQQFDNSTDESHALEATSEVKHFLSLFS